MSSSSSVLPPEIIAAYKEAKSRGLPDGWTCTIDVRACVEGSCLMKPRIVDGMADFSLYIHIVVLTYVNSLSSNSIET